MFIPLGSCVQKKIQLQRIAIEANELAFFQWEGLEYVSYIKFRFLIRSNEQSNLFIFKNDFYSRSYSMTQRAHIDFSMVSTLYQTVYLELAHTVYSTESFFELFFGVFVCEKFKTQNRRLCDQRTFANELSTQLDV